MPILQVVIQCDSLAGHSAQGVCLNLNAPGHGSEHRQVLGIHAMHLLVVRPAYEAGAQGWRKAFECGAVPGADAPGAAEHQGHCRVGLQGLFQDGKPFEQGVPCGFVGAHVNALSGMPENLLVVDHAIEVQVEDYVRAAGRGCRNVEGMVLGGHGLFAEREDACAYENAPD